MGRTVQPVIQTRGEWALVSFYTSSAERSAMQDFGLIIDELGPGTVRIALHGELDLAHAYTFDEELRQGRGPRPGCGRPAPPGMARPRSPGPPRPPSARAPRRPAEAPPPPRAPPPASPRAL